jgi:hypothetical protein
LSVVRFNPFLASDNSQEEIRKADADLMDKINQVNASADSRIILLNDRVDAIDTRIDGLNVPTIVDDPTYGRYRSYPDGSTQGRLITSSVTHDAALALVTATPKTICSIVVPPGKWQIMAMGGFNSGAATSSTTYDVAVSKVTNALPGADIIAVWTDGESRSRERTPATVGRIAFYAAIPAGTVEVEVQTTFYLVLQATFTLSTCDGFGSLQAVSVL